nr:nucleolin-like isoform X7 [Nicotiana tomentosiformis]
MRTRSAEKKSAGKQQIAAEPAAEPAAATKRTPPSRARQVRASGSTFPSPAEEAKASDADGAVQSTPEAKPALGRKTTRRVARKVVKKVPASSRTTPDKTPRSEDAGMAVPEDTVQEKVAEDSKEDPVKEKEAAESKKCVKKGDAEDSKEDHVKVEDAQESKKSIKEEETENSKEVHDKEEDAEDSKEDPVKEEGLQDLKEDAAKEKDTEDLKEDIVKDEDAEVSKEDPVKEKGLQDLKEDATMEKDAQDLKEDIVKEEDIVESKEEAIKEKNVEESKEDVVMGEDAEESKEGPVKEKDAEDLNDAGPTLMYEMDPEEMEESSYNLVGTVQDAGDSVMEDQNGNKEEQTGDIQEEPAKNTLMSLDEVNVGSDMRSLEEICHDVGTSENQGSTTTYVQSQDLIIGNMKSSDKQEHVSTELKIQEGEGSNKAKEGSELMGGKDNNSTPTGDNINANCAEDRMEEDTDKKMKGKDISVDEAGEDKIEAFADQENGEEFVEDGVPEHCEEAETLDDERAQLAAHAKERMKRKELEVFVGGLDRDAVEEDLKRVFQHVGEVIDVRMHREVSTNKNKGYAFVKFATKEQASRALSEMRNPVIRGKRCGTAPSEDNDTLFLGNICNTWTKEAVRQKLKDYGVEGVQSINLVADPKHEGLSRGFAFLEFPCHTDAMTAYKILQRPDVVFGHSERTAKVAFAEPLRDPDPEVMAQVKSVFIDGLPPYWDEDRAREKFKCFGDISRITLARNMSTAKRKDFGFVDFSTHEAAVACVAGINNTELGDGNLKAKVRARLSNPQPKTQAVKGGLSGGFRISRGSMGRGFPRGGHTFGRANFPRGRGFHPRVPGHGGRMGFAEHQFGSPYPPIRGRSNFGRAGGRWNFSGAQPVSVDGPMFLDRMRHGDRGQADDAFFRRQQFPVEGLNRPFMGRHFEDRYYHDNTDHGLKRPFPMTDPDPDYSGPSRRPRFDHSESANSLHGDRYRDNFPPGGDHYTRDYYGSDCGRGPYPSFNGGDRPFGRGYGRGYY